MFHWLRYLLAVSAAILLALPPGWCCFASVPPQADAAEPVHGCCCPAEPAPAPEDAPAAPASVCCCRADSALPPGPHPPPTDLASLAPLPAVVPAAPGAGAAPVPVFTPVSSPPLRALHCVWLC